MLVVDGRVVAAAEEERFSRRKHGKRPVPFSAWELPELAMRWCLEEAGLDVSDRIGLTVLAQDEEIWRACLTHERLIMTETLAEQFGAAADLNALPQGQGTQASVGDGRRIRVVVTKR